MENKLNYLLLMNRKNYNYNNKLNQKNKKKKIKVKGSIFKNKEKLVKAILLI